MTSTAPFPSTPFCVSRLLVTGGAGFIGSNFVRHVLTEVPELKLANLDSLTYSGNLKSLSDVEARFGPKGEGRYQFVHGDIRDPQCVARALDGVDAVVHFAAESHVDRSILGPRAFVDTNVTGTATLLDGCRERLEGRDFRFLHVSTDEVYGSLAPADPAFTETTALAPNSPYSASKAGSDLLVRAYTQTFGFPAVIMRCSNNYGPYQYPEKLIPLMVTRALAGESLPVYGDGMNIRDWVHVIDHSRAIWCGLTQGEPGAVYNVGGGYEVSNLEIVKQILSLVERPESLIQFVTDRPGHDRRYAMDIRHIRRELGWTPEVDFASGLQGTVRWYLENEDWWRPLLRESAKVTRALYSSV